MADTRYPPHASPEEPRPGTRWWQRAGLAALVAGAIVLMVLVVRSVGELRRAPALVDDPARRRALVQAVLEPALELRQVIDAHTLAGPIPYPADSATAIAARLAAANRRIQERYPASAREARELLGPEYAAAIDSAVRPFDRLTELWVRTLTQRGWVRTRTDMVDWSRSERRTREFVRRFRALDHPVVRPAP